MGQYYKYFNLDKKVCLSPSAGLKLTEHSWMGNNDVLALLQLVKTEWKNDRIIQLGDYADSEEHYSKMLQEILKVPSNLYDSKEYKEMSFEEYYDKNKLRYISKNVEMGNSSTDYKWTEHIFEPLGTDGEHLPLSDFRYLYNAARREWVDSFKIPPSNVWKDTENKAISFEKLDAYSLLVAIGNGLGGGDYKGPDDDMIGLWATTSNSIVISSLGPKEVLGDVSEYTEITPMFSNDYDCEKQAYVVKNEVLALSDYFNDAANDINVCDYHIDFEGVFQQRQVNLCFEKIKEKYENDKGKRTA